ncbi:SCO4225 family membrane protein [Streptomyces sp. NPDC007983]|uniref:SCO4225 family membrane protein n=1 Tax=Streptomyces sp. NPDC007983 TaxID=3364800 RepID=UPI0036EEA380
MTDPGRPFPRHLRQALRTIAARVYLAVCAALLVWALVVTTTDSSDDSMAGVIPLLATAPVSLVLLVLPDHAAALVVAVVLGALVNAAVIGWCARALRR